MFTYGGTSSDSLTGVEAILEEWPSLGGFSADVIEKVGRPGVFYVDSGATQNEFVFDVTIRSTDPAETLLRMHNFMGFIDPSRGPRAMKVEIEKDWQWEQVLLAEEIKWTRAQWHVDTDFILQANVTFKTVEDHAAREVVPQVESFTGSKTITPSKGNTASYPKIVFPAGQASSQYPWVVKIGSFTLELSTPIATGFASLDWENFEFWLQTAATGGRISSLVPKMSRYDAPKLLPGEPVTVTVTRNGVADRAITFYPNNRRN